MTKLLLVLGALSLATMICFGVVLTKRWRFDRQRAQAMARLDAQLNYYIQERIDAELTHTRKAIL
mgnify:CR=1 FL=1